MEIKPLYRSDSILPGGLREDHSETTVMDSLVLEIDTEAETIVNISWSVKRN